MSSDPVPQFTKYYLGTPLSITELKCQQKRGNKALGTLTLNTLTTIYMVFACHLSVVDDICYVY